jgi:transcriptional regulator with XRE-family HTH domain
MPSISLRALRQYAGRTQAEAARLAGTTQSELSRLERRDDLLLSTLKGYVRALGGAVEVTVEVGSTRFTLDHGAVPSPRAADVRSAIKTLAALPAWLPALVETLAPAQARRRVEGLGTFSVLEHVCHLRDLELEAWAVRLHALRAGDAAPFLPDFDGDRAARERDYQRQELGAAVRELLAARRASLSVLGKLKPAELSRSGTLEGVGVLSLGALITRWAGHDVGHRVELERLAAAVA